MAKQKQKTVVRDTKTLKWELKLKRVIESINAILDEESVALQPILTYTEHGIAPQLRIVEKPAQAPKVKQDVETQAEEK